VVERGPGPKENDEPYGEEERRMSASHESYHLLSNFRTRGKPIKKALAVLAARAKRRMDERLFFAVSQV
jgi:hypothetical protein